MTVAGTFGGAYLKRRGENYATKQDFDALLEQTRATAKATEQIKNELSSETWLLQQKWSNKEKHYFLILSELTRVKVYLDRLLNYRKEELKIIKSMGVSIGLSPEANKNLSFVKTQIAKELDVLDEKYMAFQVQSGPARVFLSSSATSELEKVIGSMSNVDVPTEMLWEQFENLKNLVDIAINAVTDDAKKELERLGIK